MRTTGSGKYRRRLTLERNQGGAKDGSFGQPQENWQTLATRWGSIEPLAGRELWQAQQVQPDTTHRIRLRYDKSLGLSQRDRAVYKGRVFNFLAVLNVEENQVEWEILAIEFGTGT